MGLAVASRGVWALAKRKALQKQLGGLAGQVQVMSDVEAAWLSAFGPTAKSEEGGEKRNHSLFSSPSSPQPSPHIALIAGTGSIALTKDKRGRWKRAGGLGPEKGDEGSAHWISREWLEILASYRRKPALHTSGGPGRQSCGDPVSSRRGDVKKNIAPKALRVIQLAQQGNIAARDLLSRAYVHLLHLISELTPSSRASVYLHGGLFEIPYFRRGFIRLTRVGGKRYRWLAPRCDAATAAARTIIPEYGNH